MTQQQLDTAVADATGESLDIVRGLGFSLAPSRRQDLEPEDLVLAVLCPFCRDAVAYAGPTREGSLPLAECHACDVYFDVSAGDLFAASPGQVEGAVPTW